MENVKKQRRGSSSTRQNVREYAARLRTRREKQRDKLRKMNLRVSSAELQPSVLVPTARESAHLCLVAASFRYINFDNNEQPAGVLFTAHSKQFDITLTYAADGTATFEPQPPETLDTNTTDPRVWRCFYTHLFNNVCHVHRTLHGPVSAEMQQAMSETIKFY